MTKPSYKGIYILCSEARIIFLMCFCIMYSKIPNLVENLRNVVWSGGGSENCFIYKNMTNAPEGHSFLFYLAVKMISDSEKNLMTTSGLILELVLGQMFNCGIWWSVIFMYMVGGKAARLSNGFTPFFQRFCPVSVLNFSLAYQSLSI